MRYIVGVDEVGRGPLAGPVTVGAILAPSNSKFLRQSRESSTRLGQIPNSKLKLKDSKKLSPKQREEWFLWIKEMQGEEKLFYAMASVYPKAVDGINISVAANLAAERAILRVLNKRVVGAKNVCIYLDGGLYPFSTNSKKKSKAILRKLLTANYKLQTIIRGDEKIPIISLASIVAKVTRDRYMKKLHSKYPQYGFDAHKGYGTKKHLRVIEKCGPAKVHRLTFIGKYISMK